MHKTSNVFLQNTFRALYKDHLLLSRPWWVWLIYPGYCAASSTPSRP